MLLCSALCLYGLLLLSVSKSMGKKWKPARCGKTKEFDFDSRYQPRNARDLTYCTYYRSHTCCNKTHTDAIIKVIYPYLNDDENNNVTHECRLMISTAVYVRTNYVYTHPRVLFMIYCI